MTAIILPDLTDVGKTADEAIDRPLGRSRMPIWPWIATGIGLVAVLGMITAWFTLVRRPAWLGMSKVPEQAASDDPPAEGTAPTPPTK